MQHPAARTLAHALAVSVAIPSIVLLAAALSTGLVFVFPALAQPQSPSRPGIFVQGPGVLPPPIVELAERPRAAARYPPRTVREGVTR